MVNSLVRWLAIGTLGVVCAACGRPSPPLQGMLQGELLWQGTVYLQGDVILPAEARLVIAPGTEVVFLPAPPELDLLQEHPNFPGSELIVRGRLIAEGTTERPITFRHLDPEAPAGSWGAVNIEGSPEVSFRHCRFRQADSAVHSRDARVTVEESLFEQNLVGIRFNNTEILIERNLLQNNGTAIRFHLGAPIICRNLIRDNGVGLFLTSHPLGYHIEANNLLNQRHYQVVLGEEVPDDVAMPRNYWGGTDLEAIQQALFDGQRTSYIGRVKVLPLSDTPVATAGPSWMR
ncbi:MAG: NosD domain-containing protein [Trichloromonadaceae bacterium]